MTCFDSPLSCSSSSGIHGKLTHHALFKMLLLPAGYVSLQGQNLLLSLPQLLMQRWHVKVRVWSSTCLLGLRLPLKKKIKVYLSRPKYDFLISLVQNRLSLLFFLPAVLSGSSAPAPVWSSILTPAPPSSHMPPATVLGRSAFSPPSQRKLFSCVTLLPAAYFVFEQTSALAPRLLCASSILLLRRADAAALFPDIPAL